VLLLAYWTGFLAPLYFVLRRLSGIPGIVLLHNLSSHERFLSEPLLRRLLLSTADGFITLSPAVSRELAACGSSKPVRELFHPVYGASSPALPERKEARRKLGLEEEAPVLLFFGYVRRYKGLDLLLQAMPSILSAYPSGRLLVAGQFYEPEAPYRKLVASLGLARHDELRPGYVSDAEAELLFAAADAVVLPYRTATQSGVVQLAYGYGAPVIVTPVGSLAAQVLPGLTGMVAAEVSPEAIARTVRAFLADVPARERMPEHIRSYSREHSWEALAEGAGSFLETAVRR